MTTFAGRPVGAGRRFCVVVSRFNQIVTERLAEGARETLREHGADEPDVLYVPGAFELVQGVRWSLERGYDGIVAIGSVIRGETPHFEYVCRAVTDGLRGLASGSDVPIAFGVLTTDDMDQAMARAGGSVGDKGRAAALAVLEMCDLRARLAGDAAPADG